MAGEVDVFGLIGKGQEVGLAQPGSYRWEPPRQMAANSNARPIDFLAPGTRQHAFMLDYLLKRIRWSEQKMGQFYARWRANEMRLQAFVTLPDYESSFEAMKETREWSAPDKIVVPYAMATQQTIVTYLLHTFAGRKPIHQVGAYRGEQVNRAKNMETLLQYNADYIKYQLQLHKYFNDGETYGVAIMRDAWRQEKRPKTIMRQPSAELSHMMSLMGRQPQSQRVTENVVCFEGNSSAVINPFMFFPDPRVPMHEVSKRGEFVFWRAFEGRHMLLREEAAGRLKWVRNAGTQPRYFPGMGQDSAAGLRAMGDPLTNGGFSIGGDGIGNNMQIDQGSVEIIPAELGLGPSRVPEKWLFTIVNSTQIVQAEPLSLNHGEHPVNVSEPNYFGNAFGSLGTVDLLAPHQDLMSWLVNSHMFNVRASLNNMLIVDPSKVEIDDFLDPQPGGLIRLKSTPFGSFKPEDAVKQLIIGDVTQNHLRDFQLMGRMASDMTGASDNIRGIQETGGRKSATEVRTSFEAGGSRLAAKARVYSAMGITPQGEKWASNYQQFLTQDFELRVLGQNGQAHSIRINPEEINGDFFFPIHDGTLPLDRVAMLEVWRQVWQAIAQDPTGRLQQEYNGPAIFKHMAELGGAQNIDEFRVVQGSPDAMAQQQQAGNIVPLAQLQQDFQRMAA